MNGPEGPQTKKLREDMRKAAETTNKQMVDAAASHGGVPAKDGNPPYTQEFIASGEGQTLQPVTLLGQALAKGVSTEQLQQFMDLQERHEATQARKAFNIAMAKFKKNPPVVYKDKANSQFNMSAYTSIENMVNTISKGLAKQDLSARWNIEVTTIGERPDLPVINVSCVLSHIQGHSESVSLSAPPDDSGSKNAIQQIKSTVTYLKIITFEAVTGTASEEGSSNDDGNTVGDRISEDEALKLEAYIKENTASLSAMFRMFKVKDLSQIQTKDLPKWYTFVDQVVENRKS